MTSTTPKKVGRKPLPVNELRTQFFRLRLSPREISRLRYAAKTLKKPLSRLVRDAALHEAKRVDEVMTSLVTGLAVERQL